MDVIGGKWKIPLLYAISRGTNRFGILERYFADISKQMLTKELRELEKDGIISREIFAEIPPRVEYSITPLWETLFPIIDAMTEWGKRTK
jgi:DNA-binding HxlR family transcriptional regulator